MAQGRGFELAESPLKETGGNPSRIYTGINGCVAIDEPINNMRKIDSIGRPVSYGWLTTLSDSFCIHMSNKSSTTWGCIP